MHRIFCLALLIFLCNSLVAQELIKTDWEQGYVKDGKKISVWQYFNSKKEPELVINHTTGKVTFTSKDTSDYFIFKDDKWVRSKVDYRPMPIEGSINFLNSMLERINAASSLARFTETGGIILTFDIDTLGGLSNLHVFSGLNDELDSEITKLLSANNRDWIPARVGSKKYASRYEFDIVYRGPVKANNAKERIEKRGKKKEVLETEVEEFKTPDAKYLGAAIISSPDYILDESTYAIIGKQAEFPGGMNALAKFLASNLKYPPSARRMGLEGKVLVRFVVEINGVVSDVEILSGFDGACDKEAFETVKKTKKWIPAQRKGKSVRTEYILPVTFKLSE